MQAAYVHRWVRPTITAVERLQEPGVRPLFFLPVFRGTHSSFFLREQAVAAAIAPSWPTPIFTVSEVCSFFPPSSSQVGTVRGAS